MSRHTLLIATADQQHGWDLGEQFDADGHTIYLAQDRPSTIAKLCTHAIDVMIRPFGSNGTETHAKPTGWCGRVRCATDGPGSGASA